MRSVIVIFFIFFISSCDFVANHEIFNKYHLIAVDEKRDLCLAYEHNNTGNYVCLVSSMVVAYAKVEQYIYVKQLVIDNGVILDTNYYIVPILLDNPVVYPESKIIGPLNIKEFYFKTSALSAKPWRFVEIEK